MDRFEQFFKKHKVFTYSLLGALIFLLFVVMPKVFLSLDSANRKSFLIFFFVTLGTCMVILSRLFKKEPFLKEKSEVSKSPKTYQQLLDEVARCKRELSKYHRWSIGCVLMGWVVLWIGKWSEHPPYNHPLFAIPVFVLALLAVTKNLEKENELDMSIAQCILEGIDLEKKRPELKSSYLGDLATSYQGWGMHGFAFSRVSPALWILFSLFNVGPVRLLAEFLSKFAPSWIVYASSGVIFAMMGLFLARLACRPYQWLLVKIRVGAV